MALFLGSSLAFELFDLKDSNYEEIVNFMQVPYLLDIISSFRTQRITDEYKELKELDKKIVSNTAYIIDYIGNNNLLVYLQVIFIYIDKVIYLIIKILFTIMT